MSWHIPLTRQAPPPKEAAEGEREDDVVETCEVQLVPLSGDLEVDNVVEPEVDVAEAEINVIFCIHIKILQYYNFHSTRRLYLVYYTTGTI